MEDITVKYIKEPYRGKQDILRLFRYIAGECDSKEERTRYRCGAGVSAKPDKAAMQMIKLQILYKKAAQRYGGKARRRIYHYMVSFPLSMDDANCAYLAAAEIADIFSGQYQVYYGIHEDTKNLHIHFAINAVSYVDGKKCYKSKKEMKELEARMREKAREVLWR